MTEISPVFKPMAGDATKALQAAIDAVYRPEEGTILFLEPGRYRLTDTLHLWRGIRLVGWGATRPTFVLSPAAFGFTEKKPVVHFHNYRTTEPYQDADNTTFFSGMRNIDIEIEPGNPGAVAVRFHVAQHSQLEDMDFRMGSAWAAVEDAGNLISGCRFQGGDRALDTHQTSACWQTLLLDCRFENQKTASIVTEKAGMTLVRCSFQKAPHAVVVRPGAVEQLFLKDCHFEKISQAALLTSYRQRPENQVTLRNCFLTETPEVVAFQDGSAPLVGPGTPSYCVDSLTVGLSIDKRPGAAPVAATYQPTVQTHLVDSLPAPPASDCLSLPPPEAWVNVRDCGVVGDGLADDTRALQAALRAHPILYLPPGYYKITDTLCLEPETRLFGLQPNGALLVLDPETPGFHDRSNPKPVLLSACGGAAHVSGFGIRLDRGNAGAVGLRWRSGAGSSVRDLCIGTWPNLLARAKNQKNWLKGQDTAHNFEVCKGGGGTFCNLWSENWYGMTGFYVHDTDTPSTVYLTSVEHHSSREVVLENVHNWQFLDLQTEEHYWSSQEEETSVNAVALEMTDCSRLSFANLFGYRTLTQPRSFPYMIKSTRCSQILVEGLLIFSWGQHPFDNALLVSETDELLPYRALARLSLHGEF